MSASRGWREVYVPRRMRRRTARGGDDEPAIRTALFIGEPAEGGLPSLPCPGPGGRKEKESSIRRACSAADEPVEADVAGSEDRQQPSRDAGEELGSTRATGRESHRHTGKVAPVARRQPI